MPRDKENAEELINSMLTLLRMLYDSTAEIKENVSAIEIYFKKSKGKGAGSSRKYFYRIESGNIPEDKIPFVGLLVSRYPLNNLKVISFRLEQGRKKVGRIRSDEYNGIRGSLVISPGEISYRDGTLEIEGYSTLLDPCGSVSGFINLSLKVDEYPSGEEENMKRDKGGSEDIQMVAKLFLLPLRSSSGSVE